MKQFDEQTKKRINEAVEVYKAFNCEKVWLQTMVINKYISQSEAGYIIALHG